MEFKQIIVAFFFFIFTMYQAQEPDSLTYDTVGTSVYFNSDSIISNDAAHVYRSGDSVSVDLKLISVYSLPKFNNQLDKNQYYRLRQKVYNLYPYLVVAVAQYNDLKDSMQITNNSAEFKKYIKNRQKQLSQEYEVKLKALTKTEGKIFSKLMYRSTGKTVYEIIKELRSGWSAFWWNAKAGAFDIDLKEPYDPYHIRDDAFVEAILLRAYQFGELQPIKESDKIQ